MNEKVDKSFVERSKQFPRIAQQYCYMRGVEDFRDAAIEEIKQAQCGNNIKNVLFKAILLNAIKKLKLKE